MPCFPFQLAKLPHLQKPISSFPPFSSPLHSLLHPPKNGTPELSNPPLPLSSLHLCYRRIRTNRRSLPVPVPIPRTVYNGGSDSLTRDANYLTGDADYVTSSVTKLHLIPSFLKPAVTATLCVRSRIHQPRTRNNM